MAKDKQETQKQEKIADKAQPKQDSPWADALATEREKFENFRASEKELEASKPQIAKRKASTKPWTDNRRWRPDKFRLKQQHNGFWGRFVKQSNVERRRSMGYVVANRKDWGGLAEKLMGSNEGNTSILERDGMILMEIPLSIKKDADELQELRTMNQTSAPTEWAEELGGYRKPGHFGKGRWPTTREGRIHAGMLRKSLTQPKGEE